MKKLSKILALTLVAIILCFGLVACDSENHTHEYVTVETKPTCTGKGFTTHICYKCVDSYIDNYIDALGHEFGSDGTCVKCNELKSSEGLEIRENEKDCTIVGIGNCTDLEVVIPKTYNGKTVTEIGEKAFYEADIVSVVMQEGIKTIGKNAFARCELLQSVNIPEGVTSIDIRAFHRCSSLETLVLPNSVTSLGKQAFMSSGIKNLTLSSNLKELYYATFWNCANLEVLNIIQGVEKFEDWTIQRCSNLKQITLPASLKDVGFSQFLYCSKLESINVNEANEVYKSIDGNLFSKDGSILVRYACGKTSESFEISSEVDEISAYAFEGASNLNSLTIPTSVIKIGAITFRDCTNLTTINYAGTKEQWNEISKDGNWKDSSMITKITCVDGEVDL